MSKTAIISARIEPKLKSTAERVFKKMGLTTAAAITLFYEQAANLQNGKLRQRRTPNLLTRKALDDAKARRNLESFENVESLFKNLGI